MHESRRPANSNVTERLKTLMYSLSLAFKLKINPTGARLLKVSLNHTIA